MFCEKIKHIEINYHFIKQKYQSRLVKPFPICTHFKLANHFTNLVFILDSLIVFNLLVFVIFIRQLDCAGGGVGGWGDEFGEGHLSLKNKEEIKANKSVLYWGISPERKNPMHNNNMSSFSHTISFALIEEGNTLFYLEKLK